MSVLENLLRELNNASNMGQSAGELVALNEALRGKLESEKRTIAELRLVCCDYEARHNADASKALLMEDALNHLRSEINKLEDRLVKEQQDNNQLMCCVRDVQVRIERAGIL